MLLNLFKNQTFCVSVSLKKKNMIIINNVTSEPSNTAAIGMRKKSHTKPYNKQIVTPD